MSRCLLILSVLALACQAADEWQLASTLKLTALPAHAQSDPLYPDRDTADLLARLRLQVDWHPTPDLDANLAYEHGFRWTSSAAAAGLFPASTDAPYRLTQLDWSLDDDARHSWNHEIDRAMIAWHPDWGQLTIGRQGIGLGRGVLFGAVDFFAPFSPQEVDREWRRGVDAVRAEFRLDTTTSIELIAVGAESHDDAAFLARLRGYLGHADAELIAGQRGRDQVLGAVISAVVGEAELHSEAAWFHTPSHGDVLKAVAGGSYTFAVGQGLTVVSEYHYSGFGVTKAEDLQSRLLAEPERRERLLRGDSQIMTRHAIGAQASYPLDDGWATSLTLLTSPADGSGLAMPGIRWDTTDHLTLLATLFLPWGEAADNGQLRSEYGASPISLFIQASLYF